MEILLRHTLIHALCKVNNKILRILQNKSVRTPIHVLYSNYNTLPILGLRDAQLAYLMHKYVHHRIGVHCQPFFLNILFLIKMYIRIILEKDQAYIPRVLINQWEHVT